jgi:hypothetical protein
VEEYVGFGRAGRRDNRHLFAFLNIYTNIKVYSSNCPELNRVPWMTSSGGFGLFVTKKAKMPIELIRCDCPDVFSSPGGNVWILLSSVEPSRCSTIYFFAVKE